MKKGEWPDQPDSWHCINCAGSIIMVTAEVRKEVESWLKTLEFPKDHFAFLIVETILGEEMTIMGDGVNHIYDTNPELRCKTRMLDESMKEERREQGFPEE